MNAMIKISYKKKYGNDTVSKCFCDPKHTVASTNRSSTKFNFVFAIKKIKISEILSVYVFDFSILCNLLADDISTVCAGAHYVMAPEKH